MPIKFPSAGRIGVVGAAAGVIALAGVFVQRWEGYEPRVAPDIVGAPTWCYGETEGKIPYGVTFTADQCRKMLEAKLPRYDREMMACVKVPLPDKMHVAFLSFSYNAGTGAFCRSTMAKRLNAGDKKGACDALLMWDMAGGRHVQGLKNRREDERKLCLEGAK